MGLRRCKKYAIGAGAMLALVFAIVLATGSGSAVAAQVTSVFVNNDAAHPVPVNVQNTTVPVSERSTTQLLWSGDLSGPSGSSPTMDVSGFTEIRVSNSFIACAPAGSGNDFVAIEALEGGVPYTVDVIHICNGPTFAPFNAAYDVPGRTLRVTCYCDANTGLGLAVFGRTD
jgi:hypothetical protein